MKHYLALIRKADFTDLFKYGSLHINNDMKTDFQCPVEELTEHPELFRALSYYANSFDNAFAYLIIHYTKETTKGLSNDVYIEELQHIYPLDYESKKNLEFSFDERIRIEEPLWSDSVLELQKRMMINECKKGAQNIHKIIGFDKSDFRCEDFITDDIIKEIVEELYEDRRPSGDISLWVYLLRYERHDFYPRNILGCFMDMVNVVCNRHARHEVYGSELGGTSIFKFLDSFQNPEPRFDEIYNAICKDESVKGFSSMVDLYESRIDFIKTATLFRYLRDRYSEDFIYEPNLIDSCKKYGEEFELATYLLGIVMGHMHTYDCLYEKLPLAIFKEKIVIPKEPIVDSLPEQEEKQPETKQAIEDSNPASDETTKEPEELQDSAKEAQDGVILESRMNSNTVPSSEGDSANNEEVPLPQDVSKPRQTLPKPPFQVGKLKSDGSICSNPQPVTMNSYDEYFKFMDKKKKTKGKWVIIRKDKTFFD